MSPRIRRVESLTNDVVVSVVQGFKRDFLKTLSYVGVLVEAQSPEQTELVDQIVDVIVSEGMIDRDKIKMDATIESLGLKSIDIVMILTALEEKFDVYIPMDGPFHEAKDVRSLIDAVAVYISKEKTS